MLAEVNALYDIIKGQRDQYDTNYLELCSLSNSIYSATQYKKVFRYVGIENFADYLANCEEKNGQNYAPSGGVYDGYNLRDLYYMMSDEEKKNYTYIYNTSNPPERAFAFAEQYLRDIADSIHQRKGMELGKSFVDWIAANPNEDPNDAWANFCDHMADSINVTAKGGATGLFSFLDGFRDLYDPSKVKEVADYQDAAIVALLSGDPEVRAKLGETKCDILLAEYGIGKEVGKKAIPLIVDAAFPGMGMGNALETVSNIGNGVEGNFRAGHSLATSYTASIMSNMSGATASFIADKVPFLKEVKGGLAEFICQASDSALLGENFDAGAVMTATAKDIIHIDTGNKIVDKFTQNVAEGAVDYGSKFLAGEAPTIFEDKLTGVIKSQVSSGINEGLSNLGSALAHDNSTDLRNRPIVSTKSSPSAYEDILSILPSNVSTGSIK